MDGKHASGKTKVLITDCENLLPMSSKVILFPPGYTVNNSHFNDIVAGDEFTLTPKLVEVDDDVFFDEVEFKKEASYEAYLKKRTTSCILLEMVKDGKGVRHKGMSADDTDEAKKKKLQEERKKAKQRKAAKKIKPEHTPSE